MAAYTAGQVSISNGSKAVVINSDENPESVAKGDFLFLSGSDPKEINRTYINDQQKHVIELIENWDSGNKTNQPAIVLPTTVEFRDTVAAIKNANLLINDNMQAMSDWQSKLGTVTFIGLDGTERTVPTLASFLATLGTAATKDVVSSKGDTTQGRVVTAGYRGLGSDNATASYVTYDDIGIGGGGFGFFAAADRGQPLSSSMSMINLPSNVASASYRLIAPYGATTTLYLEQVNNNISRGLVEVYSSGNSVNPLDYGLGSPARNLTTNIDGANLGKGFYATIGGDNAAAGKFPAGFSKFGSFIHSGYDPLNQLQIYADIFEDKIAFRRLKSDPTETEWAEFYHSRNTNFNDFHSDGVAGSLVAVGEAVSPTILRFYLPLNSKTRPTGITITSMFAAYRQGMNIVSDTNQITINAGLSSPKLGVLEISGSGFTTGDTINLRASSLTSNIRFNF